MQSDDVAHHSLQMCSHMTASRPRAGGAVQQPVVASVLGMVVIFPDAGQAQEWSAGVGVAVDERVANSQRGCRTQRGDWPVPGCADR